MAQSQRLARKVNSGGVTFKLVCGKKRGAINLAVTFGAIAAISACVTLDKPYSPSMTTPFAGGSSVNVGEFTDDLDFVDPHQIQFGLRMNVPVTDYIKNAVTAELTKAGYGIGGANITITGVVHLIVFDYFKTPGTQITFRVVDDKNSANLFEKRYRQEFEGKIADQWDNIQIEKNIRDCILQFINDPEAQEVLLNGGAGAVIPQVAAISIPVPEPPTVPPSTESSTGKQMAAVSPIAVMGNITDIQQRIIFNTFLDELTDYYDLVPNEEYDSAQELAFQQLEADQCTEEQCIRKIQEILQVENLIFLQMIREGEDTQLSLYLYGIDKRVVESDFCAGCTTQAINERIAALVKRLIEKR